MTPALSGSPYSPGTRALMRQAGPGGLIRWQFGRLEVLHRSWTRLAVATIGPAPVFRVSHDGLRLDLLPMSEIPRD